MYIQGNLINQLIYILIQSSLQKMNKKAQWLMAEEDFQRFELDLQTKYYFCLTYEEGEFQHHKITRLVLKQFVLFMRNRRSQEEYPFKFQKILHAAVCFFRRYFLINSYQDDDATQILICCLYISLKLNEYDEATMKKMATKWKQKSLFQPTKRHPHFGDDQYTQFELKYLSSIRFQTGYSKLIQPIEGLYQLIIKGIQIEKSGLIKEVMEYLDKVYIDARILFLYDGSKIALSIFTSLLTKRGIELEILGEQILTVYEQNREQIDEISLRIDKTIVSNSGGSSELKRLMKKLKWKKPQPRKSSQSPRFKPQHQSFDKFDQ